MRSTRWQVALLLVSSTALSGCIFNIGCELFGSLIQARMPDVDVCRAFNGDCCPDTNGDGNPEECTTLFDLPPCARFDTAGCSCTTFGDFTGIGQTLAPPNPRAYGQPPFYGFGVAFSAAGLSTAQRAFFDVVADTLETYRAVITYPSAFGFNGFLALGPPETQIGAYGVDFDRDGTVDLALPLRALSADTAYADGDGSGGLTASDPVLQHTGSHVFTTTLPRGGDGLARVKLGRVAMGASVALYAGIITNPTTPATYQVTGSFTSVDPDSGDADDGQNQAPTTFSPTPIDVLIETSPVDGLAPFLCYKTKPTKGTLCGGSAAANAGGACASDVDCGGTAGACVKIPLAKNLAVAVDDQISGLGALSYAIAKAASLCTPAETTGSGAPVDAATHLRGYQMKAAKGAPKPPPPTLVTVLNALGTVIVDGKKPDRLLVPSAKSLGTPAAPLAATDVDDFACYAVKVRKKRCAQDPSRKCKKSADCGVDGPCLTSFPKNLTAAVGDQFTTFATPKTMRIVKPTRLCLASDLNGGGVIKLGAALLCYATKPADGAPKHEKIVAQIHTTNGLARERADTVKEEELCLPSVLALAR